MFEFQKLIVYKKAKSFHKDSKQIIKNYSITGIERDQLHRASYSIPLNIAEGSGRYTNKDRRNFYIVSRSSVFECVSILEQLEEDQEIPKSNYQEMLEKADELSRILYRMIKNLE
ncbi:MAG: four helix bundle protein [Crocinitomicaceae bacterium]|nr:four helix bundle protein [Crocinitomicaceae bacterium]